VDFIFGIFAHLVKAFALLHDAIRGRVVVSGTFKKLRWRGLTALVAAYALVLQGFLAYSIATQAATQDSPYGAFFNICSSHAPDGTAQDTDAPAKPDTHCPICTVSASNVALLPEPVLIPSRRGGLTQEQAFVFVAACISFHRARAGQSRAPPQRA
jgi:hypothetical protein